MPEQEEFERWLQSHGVEKTFNHYGNAIFGDRVNSSIRNAVLNLLPHENANCICDLNETKLTSLLDTLANNLAAQTAVQSLSIKEQQNYQTYIRRYMEFKGFQNIH